MENKYGNNWFVILPALMLLCWVGFLSLDRHSGKEVVVRIGGYDPISLLSGHYIEYQIDWDNTDCSQFEGSVCPRNDFVRLTSSYYSQRARFYVSEKDAKVLDRAVRNINNKAEIVYSYKKGRKPYALRLLVNGQSFESKNK